MRFRSYQLLLCLLPGFGLRAQGVWNAPATTTWNYIVNGQPASSPILVSSGTNGQLVYAPYANEGESNAVNTIPDFSMCGYRKGGIALPVITEIKKILSPLLYAEDNTPQIQAAIDLVSSYPADSNGLRGVILLKAGTYNLLNVLSITVSGVILRGEGQGVNGTVLVDKLAAQNSFITIRGTTIKLGGDDISVRKQITDNYVATGTKSFNVANVTGLHAGSDIIVVRTPNQAWLDTIKMTQIGWTTAEYKVQYERTITAIVGNTITIDAPIVDPIQTVYGGGYIYPANPVGRITNCAVENMRLESRYDINNTADEQHGWQAIKLLSAENCWIKKVTAKNFGYSCVSIGSFSRFNTVEECAMLDPISLTTGGRKYSFDISGPVSFCLIQRCYTRGGRHDFVAGERTPGPNAFLDGLSEQTLADAGPHHRWCTGLLFDNIKCGDIYVRDRAEAGTGHGWAGAQTLFWNCVATYPRTMIVASPIGAKNWSIGSTGITDGAGYWASHGTPVTPRSLYINQLKDRSGIGAVNNVTTPAQRNGTIYELLKSWAGEGDLPGVN
ncbi:MAG: hypothetical protein ABIX01_15520 [Chitinophagaceae bacterium]